MVERKKVLKKSSKSNYLSDKLPPLTTQLLQISLNDIEREFRELEEKKLILKHKLKTSLFSQKEKNQKNFMNIKYLSNFVNNKALDDSDLYKNINLVINIFEHNINKKLIDGIAKKAISIYMDQIKFINQVDI